MEQNTATNKLPMWLEEWTRSLNVVKPRPQSWKPSSSNDLTVDLKKRAITTPARYDNFKGPPSRLNLSLLEDMPIGDDSELRSISRIADDISPASLDSSPESVLSLLGQDIENLSISSAHVNSYSDEGGYTPSILSVGDDVESRSRIASGVARRPLLNNFYIEDSTPSDKVFFTPKPSTWENSDEMPERKLAESWSSLDVFNHKHEGRISKHNGIPRTKPTDQALDLPSLRTPLPQIKEDFIIPELPSGKHLVIDILSTWGDRHYVGLNGIEIFSISGELAQISQISAEPADINVLPEYSKDPRVVSNLLDRVNRTRDDMHLWLTPFTEGNHHYIHITMDSVNTIAMIRVWNYNKSRIHSYRGARDVTMSLDGVKIFQGEIARASGGILGGTEAFGDTILFTTNEEILDSVAKHDDSFESVMNEVAEPVKFNQPERPLTADTGNVRPLTCPGQTKKPLAPELGSAILCVTSLRVKLTSTWGLNAVGLTGVQVLGETGEPLEILHAQTDPPSDARLALRLLDGINETTDPRHMWRQEFKKRSVTIELTIATPVHLSALNIFNYNESEELSYAGVKNLSVFVDDKAICENVLVRKAPGHNHYKICQKINLVKPTLSQFQPMDHFMKSLLKSHGSLSFEEYEPPELPSGFIFQFNLLSTWGDQYYLGLNGIELYDMAGQAIHIPEDYISAYPSSVNILDGIEEDVRTPEKLLDGENSTVDGRHMWLAPILPGIVNSVFIKFDTVTTISIIKIWNYGKTPPRGVKEFAILVDDLLVYNGILEAATGDGNIPHRTVIFSRDMELARRHRHPRARMSIDSSRSNIISADQSKRPFTSLHPGIDYSRSKSVLDF